MEEYVTKKEFDEAISELRREILSARNSLVSVVATQTGNYLDTLGIGNRLLEIESAVDKLSKNKSKVKRK